MSVEVAQMDAVGRLDVAIKRNEKMKDALRAIAGLPRGSQSAYSKFAQAQDIAARTLCEIEGEER